MASTTADAAPFGRLEYLYMGSADFDADVAYYRDVLRAPLVWNFAAFGARVAAFRLFAQGPLVLLADHRPAPSVLPVFSVDDLETSANQLAARGWTPDGERFEIPDGPCQRFKDPSGNEHALYQPVRPHALETEYAQQPQAP